MDAIFSLLGAGIMSTGQQTLDLSEYYLDSDECAANEAEITDLSQPTESEVRIKFDSEYATPYYIQFHTCLVKAFRSYWRAHSYNFTRMVIAVMVGLIFGSVFYGLPYDSEQRLFGRLGLIYLSTTFVGMVCMVSHSARGEPGDSPVGGLVADGS